MTGKIENVYRVNVNYPRKANPKWRWWAFWRPRFINAEEVEAGADSFEFIGYLKAADLDDMLRFNWPNDVVRKVAIRNQNERPISPSPQ